MYTASQSISVFLVYILLQFTMTSKEINNEIKQVFHQIPKWLVIARSQILTDSKWVPY